MKALHDGALTDLVRAIMNGTLPPRDEVREFYGLAPLQTEPAEVPPAPTASAVSAHTGTLKVDYGQALDQMIAAGRYGEGGANWQEEITARRFPIVGEGIVEFEWKLFDFGRDISSGSAVEAIKADDKTNPWEPAKTEHTLAYGAQFPEEQRKNPIIGLCSVGAVCGILHVLALGVGGGVGGGRNLRLCRQSGDWHNCCRFLAVRRKSPLPTIDPAETAEDTVGYVRHILALKS